MLWVSSCAFSFALALLRGATGFHDDDCELANLVYGDAVVDWRLFREQLTAASVDRVLLESLVTRVIENRHRSQEQCPLGYRAACLIQAQNAHTVIYHPLPVTASQDRSSAKLHQLSKGTTVEVLEIADEPVDGRVRARIASPAGWISTKMAGVEQAFVVKASLSRAPACVKGLDLKQTLASRWPLAQLLADIQSQSQSDQRSCDDTFHPSVDWGEFRAIARAFANAVPPWLNGLSESDAVPDEFNDALGHAQGIVWKGSSGAVAHGRTIMEWTQDCDLGLLTAIAIRAAGVVLSDGDVYRMVQRAIEGLQAVFGFVEEALQSSWPLFGLMHVLSCLKKTLHDTRFLPADLAPLSSELGGTDDATERSSVWQMTARAMREAGANENVVLLTALPFYRINFLQPLLKRANKFGILRHVLIAPLLPNVTGMCADIVTDFVASKSPDVHDRWSPCLPFVSQFPERAQFLFIHIALQLSLTVLWFDFHVFWVQNPLSWVQNLIDQSFTPLPYHDHCAEHCLSAPPDVFAADDFYAAHWPRHSLLLLRPTTAGRQWAELLLRWLCTYPYANVVRGVHYLLHPDVPDDVPSVSMLPDVKNVKRLAPIVRGLLDAEQRFVSTDGWFGTDDKVVSYEISALLVETDRHSILDRLYSSSDFDILKTVGVSRKLNSPLRPTQRLLHGSQTECEWKHVPNSFLGGYAADIETVFTSPKEAQCACSSLGIDCPGITCEGDAFLQESSGNVKASCTLRRGDPWLTQSPTGESSYLKTCPQGVLDVQQCGCEGCNAQRIDRIIHVNFADGCCEAEQKQSSETALQFGADESRPLRGDFLDSAFRVRNHVLLTFNRTPELTQHKTPSGKIGYYVWKAYVVLRTLEDPSLPWDTTVVAWTDAGIHFVGDMRPLVKQYMRVSDVAATRTPMLEGDFSKRDAFILLDADYNGIVQTNQIATGFILVRKTELAMAFLRSWLRACEDRRIMTEEPSVLGAPDYFTFKNNNDDQTAFSLLFKKHGFRAFSVGERDSVVYTGRNLAKFVKASDDFALGRESSRDDYLKAADDAAASKRPA